MTSELTFENFGLSLHARERLHRKERKRERTRERTKENKRKTTGENEKERMSKNVYLSLQTCARIHVDTRTNTLVRKHTNVIPCALAHKMRLTMNISRYGVATISRLLKIIGFFCKISSLL